MKFKSLLLLLSFSFGTLFANQQDPPPPPQKPQTEENLFNKNNPGFILNGEFIYWNVQEGALDYAIRMRSRSWGPTPSFAQGNFERAEFNWDPGYRFSLGYYRAEHFWEALGEYTFLHVKGHNHVKTPPIDQARFINGTFPTQLLQPIHHAVSDIHLHYQLVNLLAARVFHPFKNPHLRLRFMGGLTSVFMKQGWRVRYFDLGNNITSTWNRWRYWGIGFRLATTSDWYWGHDLYLTGQFSTALTMGQYHNHAKQESSLAPDPRDNTQIPFRDARYKDYRMAFTTQFILGPSYQKSFNWWRMELFAGYELTIWANLQEVFRSSASDSQGSKETWINTGLIAFQGLTTRLTFNF